MSECYMRELLSQGKDYELHIIHAMVTAVDRYLLAKSTKGRLFVTKSATMIKISHFFLSFFFFFFSLLETTSKEHLSCQVLFQHLHGKFDYFNLVLRCWSLEYTFIISISRRPFVSFSKWRI